MNYKLIVAFTLYIITTNINTYAQSKYFVKFADKNSSIYSIDNPSAFLSERAINRRTRQSINITNEDLPVNPAYIQQVSQTGATVNYALKWFNGAVVTITNSSQITAIHNLSFVNGTEKIYEGGIKGSELNIDVEEIYASKKQSLSPNELNYGTSSTQIKMMNGHILHNNGFLGEGMQIAVLDAGFLNVDTHAAFDSLRTRGRILGTKDFINPNSNIYQEHYHGMMVLSTMGGYISGQLIGTAPRAKYWLIRTENASVEQIYEEYAWAAGAEFADSVGADIINTSLGYTTFDIASQSHAYTNLNGATAPITKAANIAASKGIAVVVSAGNDGDKTWYYISVPADSPNVLTVGAVDSNRAKAAFSSFGPTSDGRIKPDVCTMGQNSIVASTTGSTGASNGTSFSAPIMAGMLACLWQAKPNLTANELIQLVKSSSSLAQSPNNSLGYGIPDVATAAKIILNNFETDQLDIFPNPFNSNITIKLPELNMNIVEYSLYSILGDEVITQKKQVINNSIDIEIPQRLPKGNYIIRVKSEKGIYFGKGVKN